MAVYKVPQDVEAEDKLIGPFGFRQFIYLIIVAFACFVAFILSKIFIGLILIPMPFIIFFTAIALPLRKDQPTETYLAAILQYNLKSKKRLWMPDGVLSTVEITAPHVIEEQRTKDLSQDEAIERLDRLSQIMDTRGWAARGVFNPDVNSTGNVSLADGVVAEADNIEDILEETSFDKLINEQKTISQKTAIDRMQQASAAAPPVPVKTPPKPAAPAITDDELEKEAEKILSKVKFDPYPSSIHQTIINPVGEVVDTKDSRTEIKDGNQTTQSTSDNTLSPDIMNLVDNSEDYTISTLAKQANRIEEKQAEEEVEIKLH